MFYSIFDDKRRAFLPLLSSLKPRFYLAGGTALAIQIGHRDSVDFDFFTKDPIDTTRLFDEVLAICAGRIAVKTQDEKNTLAVLVDEEIRLSFMTFPYPLVGDLIDEPYLQLASKEDIACMKLSAIVGRATEKDYVDVFFLLKELSLTDILQRAKEKFPALDTALILKSLVYFDDIVETPIKFTPGNEVSFADVRETLEKTVREYVQNSSSTLSPPKAPAG